MKFTIETADIPDTEIQLAEILRLVSDQIMEGDIEGKEQMDGSYRFESPYGAIFLYIED